MAVADPTLAVERALHRDGARFVIGCDEVGRGAIAGPVAVGLSLVAAGVGEHPAGLRDSKLLSEKRREELSPLAADWYQFSRLQLGFDRWRVSVYSPRLSHEGANRSHPN